MRDNTLTHKGEPIPARSWVLVPAAAICGLLWVAALFAAGLGNGGRPPLVLGAAGLAVTVALLLLIQRQHTRLRNLAGTDPLTGLVNHRGFHENLRAQVDLAADGSTPVALVLIDLDDFKAINDAYGHPYGDEVLRAVGAALRGCVGSEALAARIAGEEFALILPGADSRAAFEVAECARERVAGVAVRGLELGSSAGVAALPTDAEDAATLHQLADSALYWAKQGGKHRTRRFDPDHSPATWTDRQRAEIEAMLSRNAPLTAAFQPVVNLATGRIVGYEALARFSGPTRRSPDVWFAQAHGCGLGAELEAAAIRAALDPSGRPLDAHLAINVSPSALSSDVVRRTLAGDLGGIVVEITEHEFVPDDESLAAAVADLRGRGAKIAIDDAGAGHAGLKQLMRVRPDIVKLDRALTAGIHADATRMALVESFARFARDVGATVCAEGIETLDELRVLADLDVQWGQGFALARPTEPWTEVDSTAAEFCRASFADSFRSLPSENHPTGSSDRRLVHLSASLASARTRRDLERAMALIAAELTASNVSLSVLLRDAGALETVAENGERGGETLFAVSDYPLSRRVLRDQQVVQVVAGDRDSDPSEVALLRELGERSLLMVPVVSRGESLGLIEAYRGDDRPWSRAEINRARVIANQFASVIPALLAGAARA